MNNTQSQPGRLRSSIVRRLNTRLFFRLLGIYIGLDLLLAALCAGGILLWAEGQCAEIAALVDERGVPSAETTLWMQAGDYTVTALDREPQGWQPWSFLPVPAATRDGLRTFVPGTGTLWSAQLGEGMAYTVEQYSGGTPFAITLDLSHPVTLAACAGRVLLVCQLVSLILNLFQNAGTIKKMLRPIQDLAAAIRLSNPSAMSPEELRALAGKLNEINEAHLDTRVTVPAAQKELGALADAINGMLERIDQAYQSQKRFVSDASHELRTPISVIQGYANLLDRWGKDDPTTRQEAIDAIRTEAESMKALVEQLLFLARGDNNSTQLSPEPVELTAVASTVIKEAQMIDQTHPFTGHWSEPVTVTADPGLIKQALRVLVDNSVKYTPAGGGISITVEQGEGYARVSVQDEGQGIDGDSLPHIFDRFFRTDESRARQTGGTGLGLAIAKWIVDHHGGWFEVTSRVELGTRITVVLPL